MQRVRFGMALDGQSGWTFNDSVGVSTVGPLGFLSILETHLGLVRVPVAAVERTVQYRACLAQARTGARFYERSFLVDDLGTAAELLQWRDAWYECGWKGRVPSDAPARIRDMAAVERLAEPAVAPGPGQRLAEVAAVLATRRPQIETVELVDPYDDHPLAWRLVLALLPVKQRADVMPNGRDGSLLRELQQSLVALQSGGVVSPLAWRNDGSIVIARGESRIAAAQWVARSVLQDDRSHAIVASQWGSMLDAALEAAGRPRLGLAQPSSFRPAQQLLSLTLRLIWAPVDFRALLAFLSHPIHPIPASARRRIAQCLADRPGFGGPQWLQAKASIAAEFGDHAPSVMAEIDYWIEHRREEPAQGTQVTAVLERVARLAEFFRGCLTDPDDAGRTAASDGLSQASSMQWSLERMIDRGDAWIGPEALDTLLAHAATGTRNPMRLAQAGALACTTRPGALIEPHDAVTWWQFAAQPLPRAQPLGRKETEALRACGVDLPDAAEVLRRESAASVRVLLMARSRLTLVLPRPEDEAHPVWTLISGLIADVPTLQIEELLGTPATAPDTSSVTHRPLPGKRRWLRLPDGAKPDLPAVSSYTSLEQLLFDPFRWVLDRQARLQRAAVLRPVDGARVMGIVAHRLVERLYREPGSIGWDADRVGRWAHANLDRIVDEEGAVLRMPGQRFELAAFRSRVRRSLVDLNERLRSADVYLVEPEKAMRADSPMGVFRGYIDLVATTRSGKRIVIDLKWSSLAKHSQRMQRKSHLQLAAYAYLLRSAGGGWPAVGYYVVREAALLVSDTRLFPGLADSSLPEDASQRLWDQATISWRWRRAQLEAGVIEVALDDIEGDAASVPPEGALPPEYLDAAYNPFIHLAGWSES